MSILRRRPLIGGGGDPMRPIMESCVLEYTFDNQDFTDTSGYGNHGTVGGATFVPGSIGQYAVTHTSGSGPSSFPLSVVEYLPATFGIWFTVTSVPSATQTILSKCVSDDKGSYRVDVSISKYKTATRLSAASIVVNSIPINTPLYLVLVVEADKMRTAYLNGAVIGSNKSPVSFINLSTLTNEDSKYYLTSGTVEHFRIFDRGLSPEEVAVLYSEFA